MKMLFEESGIILIANEQVVMQGKCRGKVPEGMEMKTSTLGAYLFRLKSKQKVEWKEIDGELVLTNRRAIALNKEGTIRKQIMSCEFEIVGATVKKPRFGKEKLELLLNVGRPQAERTELEVDNPTAWVDTIKEIVSKR
jgi:hypothetical protein